MKKVLYILPFGCLGIYMALGGLSGYDLRLMRTVSLLLAMASAMASWALTLTNQSSHLHYAFTIYLALAFASLRFWPGGLGIPFQVAPATLLYTVLLLVVLVPLLTKRELFTVHFARKRTPEEIWTSDLFHAINRNMTIGWAGIFATCLLTSLGGLLTSGWVGSLIFGTVLPLGLLLGVGRPFTRKYPAHYLKKVGLAPERFLLAGTPQPEPAPKEQKTSENPPPYLGVPTEGFFKEPKVMSQKKTMVALNGSPHCKLGATNLTLGILKDLLSDRGVDLEVIHLAQYRVEYCVGCAMCLEKGKCWHQDDHRALSQRLLDAGGIILASPVYFGSCTAQLKTFIDRCLPLAHRPRPSLKPGMALCLSAGYKESETGHYLENWLSTFGAYSVGTLSAISTGPGMWQNRAALESQARHLADALADCLHQGLRYPARDLDLHRYLFLRDLVENHQELMAEDHAYWQEQGLYQGFHALTGQPPERVPMEPALRADWRRELIQDYKARHYPPKVSGTPSEDEAPAQSEPSPQSPPTAPPSGPADAGEPPPATSGSLGDATCAETIALMPRAFNPQAAGGLSAVIEFQISGEEDFISHLRIQDSKCTHHEGPPAQPSLVIQAPAAVWLGIVRDEIDGQAAYMSGLYKAKGDLGLLLKLNHLFKK